jgi:hypothetical protein
MKKNIFTAMLAIVAIGGAVLSSNAQVAPYHTTTQPNRLFDCTDGGTNCQSQIGSGTIIDADGNTVPLGFFEDKLFQPIS